MRYGYIDKDGYLRSFPEEELGTRLSEFIAAGWKPVDDIDQTKVNCEEGYAVRLLAEDAGDHISIIYKKVIDTQAILTEIASLKKELADSDYKIIKNYEAEMVNEEPPYDIKLLHSERQAIRDRINKLESQML